MLLFVQPSNNEELYLFGKVIPRMFPFTKIIRCFLYKILLAALQYIFVVLEMICNTCLHM